MVSSHVNGRFKKAGPDFSSADGVLIMTERHIAGIRRLPQRMRPPGM